VFLPDLFSFSRQPVVHMVSVLIRLVVVAVLVWLAIVDVRTRRLPNLAVAVVGTLFFVDAAVMRMPIDVLCVHLIVGFAVLCAACLLFFTRVLGGGDAKLAAVIFLWTGSALLMPAFTLISVVGTLVSLISLATFRMDAPRHRGLLSALALFSGARGVPYGVALAAGGSIVILSPAAMPYLLAR
jgi:prepilin peptidase CpaA